MSDRPTFTAPSTGRDVPVPAAASDALWGSDVIAATLRALGVPFLALNPGASYRGLHDSLVNHLGNAAPEMLLCLHEEVAVAIAHGYAKAGGGMMGVVLHSNVGLMHAAMAIFNAWCDRLPMLILGATGPWDAARRRPWIDWIHTVADQGALVRDYTKWDNQPGSVAAAVEALLRAAQIAQTAPRGPVYVNLDAALQEQKLDDRPALPDPSRFAAPVAPPPAAAEVECAAALLAQARRPVILMGRMSLSVEDWRRRVELAERTQAAVITDLKTGATFPTAHPQHAAPPGNFMAPAACAALREADVVLMLDWVDPGGAFRQAGGVPTGAKVIQATLDAHLHRGWAMDMGSLAPADVQLQCEPDAAVRALLPLLPQAAARHWAPRAPLPGAPADGVVSIRAVAEALAARARAEEICIVRLPLGWNGAYRDFSHPLDYLGADGGGGVGAGPGNTVGAALALRGSGRTAVALIGDGDFLMANTAVWTAAHYGLGMLLIVCNNRSFFNDELHQERVAKERGRPPENKWIGQRIDQPDIDIAQMARTMGAVGIGPVDDARELGPAIAEGLAAARAGRACVIDARVAPGYDANMSGAPPSAASQKR
ncbi:MAG: thiamine pyrophosphate-binding protein [Burkholderiales bacterium]|nr:thiamine pyrophosphate-binding protein [Burkholderiales bacterium]